MPEQPKYNILSVEMYTTDDGFRLDWSAEKMGFGILLFKRTSGVYSPGKYEINTEEMSKEFCEAVIKKFLDVAYKD